MKKMSTLLWAMMMGISLMAVPHKNHAGEKIMLASNELVELTSPEEIITKRLSDAAFAERKFVPASSAESNSTDSIVAEVFKTVVFEAPASVDYITLYEPHMFYMANENEDYRLDICVNNPSLDKEFTLDDLAPRYTGLSENREGVELAALTGKIYQVGDTTKMHVVALGKNAVEYTFEMWYAVPTPIDTVEFTILDADFTDYFNEYGLFLISGYTEDANYYASLALYGDEVAGTYINDGKFGSFGAEGGVYDIDIRNSSIGKLVDVAGLDYARTQIIKGSVEVTMEEQDGYFNVTAVADVVCEDSVCYLLTVKSVYEPYYEHDSQEAAEKIFTASDRISIQYSPQGLFAYVDLISSDVSEYATFMFFVDEFDEDIIIPEGTYKINGLGQPGTVMEGFMSNGAIYPSFYSHITERGAILVPLWFVADGTVTVERVNNTFKLEANAVNTYGYPVHIVYDPTITAVEDVEVHNNGIEKRVINGQLIILRDGVEYNVLGATR